ncbi:N-acetyltransferase family protein [Oxalobacteraceae bacterium A2-2]
MKIRPYQAADFPAICAIYADAKRDELGPVQVDIIPLQDDPGLLAAFHESQVTVCEDGEVLGFSATFEGQLRALFIHSGARGKGAGGALLAAALASPQPCTSLRVAQTNVRAIKFYERHGFKVSGRASREYNGQRIVYLDMVHA